MHRSRQSALGSWVGVECPPKRVAVHVNRSLQGVQLHHPALSHFSVLLALYPCNIHAFLFLPFCWFIAPQPTLGEQSASGTDYLLEGIWYIALIMRTIFFFKALQICLKSKYNEAMQHHLIVPIICQA